MSTPRERSGATPCGGLKLALGRAAHAMTVRKKSQHVQ